MPSLTFSFAHPLPAGLPPEHVIQALHRYEPLITPNPYLVSFRRRPVDLSEIVNDAFFREDGHALAAFEVVDRIVLVPGLASKQVVIPCVMQRFSGGVRCRSLAAGGVRVWSTWRVVPAPAGGNGRAGRISTSSVKAPPPTPPAPPPKDGADDAAAYELIEDARVECSALVKPFVGRSFQSAHLEILRQVVGTIEKTP